MYSLYFLPKWTQSNRTGVKFKLLNSNSLHSARKQVIGNRDFDYRGSFSVQIRYFDHDNINLSGVSEYLYIIRLDYRFPS